MKKNKKVITVIMLLVLLGAFAYESTWFNSLSIIGEEGYEPYDPLLASGSYDQTRWFYTGTTYDGQPFGCVGGSTSCNGGTQVCSEPLTTYQGVSASANSITVSPLGYGRNTGYQGPYVRTMNLRLIDFKTEWSISVTRCGSNKYLHGGGILTTNRGTVYQYPEGSGTSPTGPIAIELLWDDYELGHYQIKANGLVVQEGIVAEGEELYFQIEPDTASCNSECTGTATLSNPRVRSLFSCDPQAGTVKVHECFAGPDTVSINDLQGFERFCTTLPATFSDAGLVSSSKRVYYELAQNGDIEIDDNQVWEFQYLANAQDVGASELQTGVVELCTQAYTPIEDLKDLPIPQDSVTEDTITWSSYAKYNGASNGYGSRKTTLLSGTQKFMAVEDVKIDEIRCPYQTDTQEFPQDGLSTSCFSVRAFNHDFHNGDTWSPVPGMSVTLDDLKVRYQLDNGEKERVHTATWVLTFEKDMITTTPIGLPETIEHDQTLNVGLRIDSKLPSPASVITVANVQQGIIGETIGVSINTALTPGQSTIVTQQLTANTLGEHYVTTWTTLQTEAGNIAFETTEAKYDVLDNGEHVGTETSETKDWLARLWMWIKNLFS